LLQLYTQYGFYLEDLISITKKGMNGQQEIAHMMERFRSAPPQTLASKAVVALLDYQKGIKTDLKTNNTEPIPLPKSNVLQFLLEDGSKISARPSGTEPKIKFYFSVYSELTSIDDYERVKEELKKKIQDIINEMNLRG
ncbi:MAG: phospho-sugar mutase, partial [Flavisolibacter sp.]|nr:phospho-sugar mutase [Flavisolibacter sp.]